MFAGAQDKARAYSALCFHDKSYKLFISDFDYPEAVPLEHCEKMDLRRSPEVPPPEDFRNTSGTPLRHLLANSKIVPL
jgi:hypothetical protein